MARVFGLTILVASLLVPAPGDAADWGGWCRSARAESFSQTVIGIAGQGPSLPGVCKPLSLAQVVGVRMPARPGAPARKLSSQEVYSRAVPSILYVEANMPGDPSQGSAVAISPTVAMTNCHVVMRRDEWGALKDLTPVLVRAADGPPQQAVLFDRHPDIDICLIKTLAPSLQPVQAITYFGDVRVGDRAYTLGNPRGLQFTFAEGIVSGVRPESTLTHEDSSVVHANLVQTTAPILHGSSGGGLFDEDGNLIGITQSADDKGENLNFVIAADVLWVRYGELIPMPPNPLLK